MSAANYPTINSPLALDWGYGLGTVTLFVLSCRKDDTQPDLTDPLLVTGIVIGRTGKAAGEFEIGTTVEVLYTANGEAGHGPAGMYDNAA